MTRSQRLSLIFALAAVVIVTVLVVLRRYCPPQGIAFSSDRRARHLLKNRTALPQTSDFDGRVTLASMLQPGDDRVRWSHLRAARVEGYVVDVRKAGIELANCWAPCGRDIHINLALRPDAPDREQVVLEVTPRMEDWAHGQGWDWSEQTLRRELLGHWCYFEGWMFFDSGHDEESENIAPGRPENWRATAWEIHPVTFIKVIR